MLFVKREDHGEKHKTPTKTVKEFCTQHPDDMDIVRFVLFDADTRRAYDHAIYEAEINQG